ncbi:MAG: threonine/serine dehydratase [Candidatus Thermoplasmatota archaeon]|nr:threonine/serine dehydratase [Candidatus Thermoplasmatota archaeon]
MEPPTLDDIRQAEETIRPYLDPSPLLPSPALSQLLGFEVRIKLESLLPTGSFKIRGGINIVSHLSSEERSSGIIASSTGNHGQSIAFAGRQFGVHVIIGAPAAANPVKVAAMEALGARVVLHGKDFDEAREWVEAEAKAKGYRYIHSANEPLLIAGVGTAALEAMRQDPQADVFLVPVGGGSGASGYSTVIRALRPEAEVIGVQSERAPAFYRSWKEHRMVEMPSSDTFAEGLQTRVPFALTMDILWKHLDDLVLVSDDELGQAVATYLWKAHLIAEGAAAAPLAAAFRYRDRWRGKRVVLALTGHNIAEGKLRDLLARYDPFAT